MGSRIFSHLVSGELDYGSWVNGVMEYHGGHMFLFLLIPVIGSLSRAPNG